MYNIPQREFGIEKLVYYPSRTHQPMPLRPYVFNVYGEAVEQIQQRMEQHKTTKISSTMLSGLSSGFVVPSPVAYESVVNADWVGTRRFLFMMKVKYFNLQGVEINSYIFGYTEYDGISLSGDIDLEMPHYINNIVDTSVYMLRTPMGMQRVEKLLNMYNTIYSVGNSDFVTQRPVDIYQSISANEIANYMPSTITTHPAANILTPFSNNVVSSGADNGITSEYLSKILTSGVQGIKSQEIHVNSYQMTSEQPYEKFYAETSLSDNEFVRALSLKSGLKTAKPVFKFGTLNLMDASIYSRFQLFNLTTDFANPLLSNTPEIGENWGGRDMVTIKAFSLLENTVALATKYGFTVLSMMATNMTDATGHIAFSVLNFNSFLTLPTTEFSHLLNIFEERFKTDIFLNDSALGTIPLMVEIHVNLSGSSKIYIEYAGASGVWYTAPTFANSLYNPVVVNDQNAVNLAANQVQGVIETILEAQPVEYF